MKRCITYGKQNATPDHWLQRVCATWWMPSVWMCDPPGIICVVGTSHRVHYPRVYSVPRCVHIYLVMNGPFPRSPVPTTRRGADDGMSCTGVVVMCAVETQLRIWNMMWWNVSVWGVSWKRIGPRIYGRQLSWIWTRKDKHDSNLAMLLFLFRKNE